MNDGSSANCVRSETPPARAAAPATARPGRRAPRILVLGLGNDLLTDDAIGLRVAAEVQRRLGEREHVTVAMTLEIGASTLDLMVGYDALVLVDSIQTGRARPGHVHAFSARRRRGVGARSPHGLGVEETCALGRALGLEVPRTVRIVAIEVADPFTLGTAMTPAVEQAIDFAADCVLARVQRLASGRSVVPAPR